MEKTTADVIEALKREIQRLGFTEKEVERQLGLPQGYLSRLFGGQIQLKADHVAQIARVLKVDPEEIFLLAFRKPRREASILSAPDPTPEELAEIERDIDRIVQRVLDQKAREENERPRRRSGRPAGES